MEITVLQYFVTASDTGNKIPVEIDKSTDEDLAATKEHWQTDWTSEFIGDPALEKYTAKTENGEIVALGLTVKPNPVCSFISNISRVTRKAILL